MSNGITGVGSFTIGVVGIVFKIDTKDRLLWI